MKWFYLLARAFKTETACDKEYYKPFQKQGGNMLLLRQQIMARLGPQDCVPAPQCLESHADWWSRREKFRAWVPTFCS